MRSLLFHMLHWHWCSSTGDTTHLWQRWSHWRPSHIALGAEIGLSHPYIRRVPSYGA
jgi:hypothetical protein